LEGGGLDSKSQDWGQIPTLDKWANEREKWQISKKKWSKSDAWLDH